MNQDSEGVTGNTSLMYLDVGWFNCGGHFATFRCLVLI
jgi:hypothetical protein